MPSSRFFGFSKSRTKTIFMSGRTLASDPCSVTKRTSPCGLAKALSRKASTRPFGTGVDLLDVGLAAELLDGGELHQQVDVGRQRPEPVDELGGEALDLLVGLQRRQPTVQLHAQLRVLHVDLGDGDRRAGLDLRRPGLLRRLVGNAELQRLDRLAQHLLVQLVADLLDVAGLLVAEQVAGAADVEVVGGQLEPGAERVERIQHLEPLLGLRRHRLVRRAG